MSKTVTGLYLAVPALVYLTIGVLHGEPFVLDRDTMLWLWPNYLFFAAPQLAWAVIHRVLGSAPTVAHGGQIGATIALLSLHFSLATASHAEDGWIVYWPLAGIAIGIGCACAMLKDRWRQA
jgi:hypothetical protein